ncbi:uncharacterized protein [Argopecten irradians]|uniref:uncharacterized protein n=1 Tax=Argopecten irradians TaxID=31199 RepID=UPI0037205A76
MYPLVYSLLPSKTQTTYQRFFTLLKTKMTELNLQLNPTTVFLDFETAAQNAIRSVFPAATLKGCFFHFTQCIWRKAQQTGLQQLYADNDDIRRLVRRAAALPLVPLNRIEDVWFHALNDLEDADVPQYTTAFTDYVITQWIERDQPLWNHFETEGPRTTNHVEGWHNKLKKKVEHSHPNIYSIIRVFQEIQANNEITRIQHAAGGQTRPRAKRYRNIDSRLTQLKERLETGAMDVIQYIDAASHLLHLE